MNYADGKSTWYFWPGAVLITAVYLTIALSRISNLALIDPDEPRYAGAGRTMAHGSSLLVPQFNGAPRINKPPLFYWLVAISDTLSGKSTETSARIPSVVMGLLMLWGTIWLGRHVFGPRAGVLGGLILATCPLFLALSRCCITDMTLSAFMAGSLGFLMLAMCGLSPPRQAGWIAAVLLGFAVLTKATAALAVILVVVIARTLALPKLSRPAVARWLPWMAVIALIFSAAAMQFEVMGKRSTIAKHKAEAAARAETDDGMDAAPDTAANIWQKLDSAAAGVSLLLAVGGVLILAAMAYRAERLKPALPAMWKIGLAVALGMGLWWYVVLIGYEGMHKFLALIDFEIKQRVAGAVHREGMYYYIILLPAVTVPWAIGLPGSIAAAWPKESDADTPQRRADSFLLAWIGGIVLFFSIPGAKLATYILSALPAVALLTARFFEKLWLERERLNKRSLIAVQMLAALIGILALAVPIAMRWVPDTAGVFVSEMLGADYEARLWLVAGALALAFCGGWFWAIHGRSRIAPMLLGCATAALIFAAIGPAIERLNHRSTKEVCAQTRAKLAGCSRIVALGVAPESLSYYLEQPVEELRLKHTAPTQPGAEFVSEIVENTEPTGLFIDKRYYARIFGRAEAKTLKPEEMEAKLPPNLQYIYSNQNMLVVRNRLQKKITHRNRSIETK